MRLFVWAEEELPCCVSGLRDKDFPLRILQHEDDVKQARRIRRGRRDDSGPGERGGGGRRRGGPEGESKTAFSTRLTFTRSSHSFLSPCSFAPFALNSFHSFNRASGERRRLHAACLTIS